MAKAIGLGQLRGSAGVRKRGRTPRRFKPDPHRRRSGLGQNASTSHAHVSRRSRTLAFAFVGISISRVNRSVTFAAYVCAFKEGARMTNTAGIPGDRICSFIERVERIDEEIKALNEGKKEVFAEAKGEGFDVKVLREILRLRKQDKDERDEQDSLLDLYLRAMESTGSSQARAA
jgi:uncharacterized protein (UPF0335 family)